MSHIGKRRRNWPGFAKPEPEIVPEGGYVCEKCGERFKTLSGFGFHRRLGCKAAPTHSTLTEDDYNDFLDQIWPHPESAAVTQTQEHVLHPDCKVKGEG